MATVGISATRGTNKKFQQNDINGFQNLKQIEKLMIRVYYTPFLLVSVVDRINSTNKRLVLKLRFKKCRLLSPTGADQKQGQAVQYRRRGRWNSERCIP
jgi:hypothetical protein